MYSFLRRTTTELADEKVEILVEPGKSIPKENGDVAQEDRKSDQEKSESEEPTGFSIGQILKDQHALEEKMQNILKDTAHNRTSVMPKVDGIVEESVYNHDDAPPMIDRVPSEMVKIPLTTVLSDHNSHHSRNSFKSNNEDFDSDDELLESLKTTSIEKMKSSQKTFQKIDISNKKKDPNSKVVKKRENNIDRKEKNNSIKIFNVHEDHCKCDEIKANPKLKTKVCSIM
ncbi:hypothetical protein WR25_02958 [Diploscapter pachys]|uniref:Uncharacterized protein n=1 Tax=Diploscapter pachys TaxID=2018661 RepID=A0A2A2JRW8_9BILA|nr:hypothetical protein WR25_02958 [Diploscapter pachys]